MVQMLHGSITFVQGAQTSTWHEVDGMPGSYLELPEGAGYQVQSFYQPAGCAFPACATINIAFRSVVRDSGALFSLELAGTPLGDVEFNGAPPDCRLKVTRHDFKGVLASGDCSGVTFVGVGAPVGKFTLSLAP